MQHIQKHKIPYTYMIDKIKDCGSSDAVVGVDGVLEKCWSCRKKLIRSYCLFIVDFLFYCMRESMGDMHTNPSFFVC